MKNETMKNNSSPGLSQRKPSRSELIDSFARAIGASLPATWNLVIRAGQEQIRQTRVDAIAEIQAPDGNRADILVEAKSALYPRDIPKILAQLQEAATQLGADAVVVAAPFISPRAQTLLAQANAGYADSTGNLRLQTTTPAAFIVLQGAKSDPWPENEPLRSLRGRSAGRAVRAFCDFRPPFGIEELAVRSQTSIASVSRVAALLDREGLVTRDTRGKILAVQWQDLIERWTQDYALLKSNTARMYLEPRQFSDLLRKLRRTDRRYAVSGSLPAALKAPVAASRLAVIFTPDLGRMAEDLRISPVEEVGNVYLLEPFDTVAFDRTWQKDGVTYAALTQVAADLLTSPGRGPAEGRSLLDWMAKNEHAWRS